jgi:hypothetical protein
LPGTINGSCSALLEPDPNLKSTDLPRVKPGATTSRTAVLELARQRYCPRLTRYRNTQRVSADRLASQLAKPARKAGFSTFESGCGRETDCLLEGDGFELPVPVRQAKLTRSCR